MNSKVYDLIHQAEEYIDRETGTVMPEAFPYLKGLADMGYIKSFRWLADCYIKGIGCAKDCEKGLKLGVKAIFFDDDEYCRRLYASWYPTIEDYDGDNPVTKALKTMVCSINDGKRCCARVRIAKLILDGKIKEYAADSAMALLYNIETTYGLDEFISCLLGECLLYGIGTKADPISAMYILKDGMDYKESAYKKFLGANGKARIIDDYYTEDEYQEVYEYMNTLLDTAKSEAYRITRYDYDFESDDFDYYRWEDQRPFLVKRAD